MVPKKILVADDDRLICWALEKEFAALGHSTRAVDTCAEALSELNRQPYDLVFFDIDLPDSNGIELLRIIGRTARDAKIVIMSGKSGEGNRLRAIGGNSLQLLEKPFDLSDIHGILRSAAGGYPQRRKHPRHICRVPVQISILEPLPEESLYDLHNLSGRVIDIDSGGLKLRTEYPLRAGQGLRIHLPAGYDSVLRLVPKKAVCEVVWVLPSGDGVTAGLKFLT
ncbi:MAG: response regulator [Deltaproteobacteria bacterium]|nr:response regulator [Candidatus Deferrimicrobiaceae bacterium]